jgi:hypothetical protein
VIRGSELKKVRINVAQKVVATARRLNQEQGNVQVLPTTRLERGTADGKPSLTAVFPINGGGEPHRLDLSYLLDFPGLAELFAEGVLQWGKPVDPKSRIAQLNLLRRYWFVYLSESRLHDIPPERLDEQVMAGFNAWLHQKRQINGQPLHPNTIRVALGALRNVLAHSPGAGEWLDLVPAGPRGVGRKTEPTEVLQLNELLQVMAAAEKEVLALHDRWEEGQRLLKQGHVLILRGAELESNPGKGKGRNPKSLSEPNLALALAMLDKRYPGVIPNLDEIKTHDERLWATIKFALGQMTATSYFYASGRNLVPLALCIGFATVFNPETVLRLKWKNIDRTVDRLGNNAVKFDVRGDEEKNEKTEDIESDEPDDTPLVRIIGDKPRANRQLVRLLDPEASAPAQASLNLVLDLLAALTARIRPHVVAPEYRDSVFLFVQKVGEKRAKGLGNSKQCASSDAVWVHALTDFVADHKLPDFSLKTLRATLLDFVQLFNRGDLDAAQQVGNHGRRLTTWTHYTSDLVKRLLKEATGETLLVRERWLDSGGKLDPRQHRDWTSKGCATPGWMCLDPYDSPRPNQKQERLCTAYGECPDCPLAAARPDNPHNIMLYEALRRAVYRSVTRVTAPVWQQRWAPVVVALDALLKDVQPAVLERSRSLRIELPDVG